MNRFRKLTAVIMAAVMTASIWLPAYNATTEAAVRSNQKMIFRYLVEIMELPASAACGILANIERESGFDPRKGGDGNTSYGICQWHASRYGQLRHFCDVSGLDYTSLGGQLAFLDYELREEFPGLLRYLKSLDNGAAAAYEAGYAWCYTFERPAGYEDASLTRGALAQSKYWPRYGRTEEAGGRP